MKISSIPRYLVGGVVCSTLFLASCTFTDERYLNANTLPPVVVPDGLDNETLGESYAVPEGDGRLATGELKKPLPPTLSSSQLITEPRVQTVGDASWLVVPKEAAATWSQLVIYLQSRQISIVKQDVFSALIDTSWITESAKSGTAFRYQLRLEPGMQPEFTEIHAVNMQGTYRDEISPNTVWKSRSDSQVHKAWFLKQIAKGLSQQKSVGDSLVASAIVFPPRIVSTSFMGEPVIDLTLNEERTNYAIANSLKENEFTVFEENKSAGVVYFSESKNSKKKKKKFLARLKSFLDRISSAKITKEGLVTNKSASADLDKMLAHLPNEAEVNALFPNRVLTEDLQELSNLSGYFLVQRSLGDGKKQRLHVRDAYGRLLEPAQAKELLDRIKQQLF
jgi:uncharacterized lipoprotein